MSTNNMEDDIYNLSIGIDALEDTDVFRVEYDNEMEKLCKENAIALETLVKVQTPQEEVPEKDKLHVTADDICRDGKVDSIKENDIDTALSEDDFEQENQKIRAYVRQSRNVNTTRKSDANGKRFQKWIEKEKKDVSIKKSI
jgi:hypothetical protein